MLVQRAHGGNNDIDSNALTGPFDGHVVRFLTSNCIGNQ